MKKELELKLVELYPEIFRDYGGDMRYTCMAWGMTCGDGWYSLLDSLCQTIELITKGKDAQVIADQVKEKFGALRFYYHIERKPNILDKTRNTLQNFMCRHGWGRQYNKIIEWKGKYYKSVCEKVSDAVGYAEMQSYRICDRCGGPGERRGGGWVRVTCIECDQKEQEEK